jgi:hypothetical protein
MNERTRPLPNVKPFGCFTIHDRVVVGEWADAFATKAALGHWDAYVSEPDPGDGNDLGRPLLLCVAEAAVSQIAELYSAAEPVAEFGIEGARVVVGDSALAGLLTGPNATDNFYDHLDGVHGSLKSGDGVTMMLDGDGRGSVRVARLHDLAVAVVVEVQ